MLKDELLKMMKDKKRINNVNLIFYINPVMVNTFFKQIPGGDTWGLKP